MAERKVMPDHYLGGSELTFKYRITDVNGKSEGFGNSGVHVPHGMAYSVAGLVRDIESGIIKNISVGYNVRKYEIISAANRRQVL